MHKKYSRLIDLAVLLCYVHQISFLEPTCIFLQRNENLNIKVALFDLGFFLDSLIYKFH